MDIYVHPITIDSHDTVYPSKDDPLSVVMDHGIGLYDNMYIVYTVYNVQYTNVHVQYISIRMYMYISILMFMDVYISILMFMYNRLVYQSSCIIHQYTNVHGHAH